MVGQKLFKTRICVLYRRGHCHRHSCSFAHGDAELRRYNTSSSSFNGRQDYRGADLRDKLGRHHSPFRRNSFDKDGHDDQLKQVQSEIDMLEDHKQELQIYLEERVQEADSLNSKIEELEMQLSMEKDECRRISSKIRKFVKANHRHSRIQDELKRSQARVERLGEQLGFDARAAANEDDISINIFSDEETLGNVLISPKFDNKISPSKKRMRAHMVDADEKSKHGEWVSSRNMRSERDSRRDPQTKNDERRNVKFREGKSSKMVTTFVDEVELKENIVLPPPPPLPIGHNNAYLQYKGEDEKLDDIVDEDEMLDVDIV